MCGIFGEVSLLPSASPWKAADAARVSSALGHRGPDGAALWSSPVATLGMQRLAIVAHDEPAEVYSSGGVTSLLNGEIYNHRELRRKLESRGHVIRSQCDAALLPALFLEYGQRFANQIDGQFAVAILDTRNAPRLFLGRDPIGIKPLFYTAAGGRVSFASEVKALIAGGRVAARANLSTVGRFLQWGFLDEDDPLLQGVHVVPPGTVVCCCATGFEAERYWSLGDYALLERDDASEHLSTALRQAVFKRQAPEVPSAVLLSGGLDSSLIATLARNNIRDAYTLAVPGYDESERGRACAEALGLRWHRVEVPVTNFEELCTNLWHLEIPDEYAVFGMATAQRALARQLREDGVKMVLTGEGADELFIGYGWDRAFLAALRGWNIAPESDAVRCLGARPDVRMAMARMSLSFEEGEPRAYVAAMAASGARISSDTIRALFRPGVEVDTTPRVPRGPNVDQAVHLPRAMQLDGLGRDILMLPILHTDRLLMAHGVEARLPFLDTSVLDAGLRATDTQLADADQDKALLRQLSPRHYPAKRGFAASGTPDIKQIADLLEYAIEPLSEFLNIERLRGACTRLKWRAALCGLTLTLLDTNDSYRRLKLEPTIYGGWPCQTKSVPPKQQLRLSTASSGMKKSHSK